MRHWNLFPVVVVFFLRESCPRVPNTRNDTLVLSHPLGFRLCTYARVKQDEAQAQNSKTSAGQRDTLLFLKAWKTHVHYLHHQSTNTPPQFPTWKVWGALGEVAEDGQTRYSQQKRISDGWESPIWEEHPWSLRVLELFLLSVRKSRGSIGVLSSASHVWDVRSHVSVVSPHPPTAPLRERDRGGALLSECISNCVLLWWSGVESAHLEDRRSHAWSQRPRVPCQTHAMIQ